MYQEIVIGIILGIDSGTVTGIVLRIAEKYPRQLYFHNNDTVCQIKQWLG